MAHKCLDYYVMCKNSVEETLRTMIPSAFPLLITSSQEIHTTQFIHVAWSTGYI